MQQRSSRRVGQTGAGHGGGGTGGCQLLHLFVMSLCFHSTSSDGSENVFNTGTGEPPQVIRQAPGTGATGIAGATGPPGSIGPTARAPGCSTAPALCQTPYITHQSTGHRAARQPASPPGGKAVTHFFWKQERKAPFNFYNQKN